MNSKAFTTPQIIIFVLALAVVVGGYLIYSNRNSHLQSFSSQGECEQKTGGNCVFAVCDYETFPGQCGGFSKGWVPIDATSTPNPIPSPAPVPNPVLSSECEKLTGYTTAAYREGWKEAFKKENNLSEPQFNAYITVTDASLLPIGNTCELTVRYSVKKDYLTASRVDNMTLSVPPAITPNNLPLESDPTTSGRSGVSTINLNKAFAFVSSAQALDYFVNSHNLTGTGASISYGFQYFWDKESAESKGSPFAGKGGEAYIQIRGTINESANKCYSGQVSLVTKETVFNEGPCRIN